MQTSAQSKPKTDRKLTLEQVLHGLVADGLVSRDDAEKLKQNYRTSRTGLHPLAAVAEQKWRSAKPPNKFLHLEALTEWLAQKANLPYFHIDPLKIDLSAVTSVMKLKRRFWLSDWLQ
ncbi:MAG TPA: hypothetical protein VNN78_04555 [Burkholderiales bacterium]|nr:hypothetical protein [Burkholderiales bacterium]